jgi:hypothetical protein
MACLTVRLVVRGPGVKSALSFQDAFVEAIFLFPFFNNKDYSTPITMANLPGEGISDYTIQLIV